MRGRGGAWDGSGITREDDEDRRDDDGVVAWHGTCGAGRRGAARHVSGGKWLCFFGFLLCFLLCCLLCFR